VKSMCVSRDGGRKQKIDPYGLSFWMRHWLIYKNRTPKKEKKKNKLCATFLPQWAKFTAYNLKIRNCNSFRWQLFRWSSYCPEHGNARIVKHKGKFSFTKKKIKFGPVANCGNINFICDLRLPPRCWWVLRSSEV
jgi:hypothetical protein